MADMTYEFKKFVFNFDFDDVNIQRKYYHSLRVMNLCKLIGADLGLSAKQIDLLGVIGLLHDYGRFYQWEKYHTYVDRISIDHGDYAVMKLFDDGEIVNFYNNNEDYDEIYDAIKYHNKYEIPSTLSSNNQLYAKIIRDADKLDILYLWGQKSIVIKEDGVISSAVKESFRNGVQVNNHDICCGADGIIRNLCFVYDINFAYSFKYLRDYNIIDNIFENINDKEQFRPYFEIINRYINEKLKEMN